MLQVGSLMVQLHVLQNKNEELQSPPESVGRAGLLEDVREAELHDDEDEDEAPATVAAQA